MNGNRAVRIIPAQLEFSDVQPNKVQKINIAVKNIDKHSREIRCHPPQSKNFTLKVKNPDIPVAPGLEVQAVLEYCNSETFEENDRFIVTVDGEVVEVPVIAGPSKAILELQGSVSFGNVVAKSKVISREIPLFNHGSKAGDFKIKYSGDKPIAIVPSAGSIPPKSVQLIKVEYVTRQSELFDEIAKVKLEGQESSLLRIFGEVVEGSLELLAYETEEPLRCVTFGCTYYGTDKTESAILYNNSPEPICFVAVLDEDAVGQELGVDLTKSATAKLAENIEFRGDGGDMNGLTSLVTAIPNQGMLGPYEKIPLFFRFSPRWKAAKEGFKTTQQPPPRKDFSMFMQLKIIGASKGFDNTDSASNQKNGSVLEVALTGTALPVLISISPQTKYQFGDCPVGEHTDMLCTVHNDCNTLPVSYQFRRVAHFLAKPANGKIRPQESQEILLSFSPNQIGTFQSMQYIDMIGPVADSRNPFIMHLQVIHSVPVKVSGNADPCAIKKQPVYNPGITPKITNEVGLYAETAMVEATKDPRNALHNAQFSKLHRLKMYKNTKNENDKVLLSFPNDRASSIRPSNRREKYQSIFTRTDRHTFVDPDYAYTDEEAEAIEAHKQHYADFIDKLRVQRQTRHKSKEYILASTSLDIGIKPAAGLRPRKLRAEDAIEDFKGPPQPNAHFKLLSQRELAKIERMSSKRVRDGLNAVPTSNKEKMDCQKILSPQELHQVIIGPPLVDFGKVCLRSTSRRDISIVNNLDTYIHIIVQVDCRELRQTSPLSQVVPPKSKALLPLIFESNTRGKFQRSLDYSINGFYKNHVTVLAEVVPVSLELSSGEIELLPSLGLPAEAGIRGVVSLKNPLNHPAEFTWSPILGERGTAFSIRPATGFVEANADLDCEVVFHPSFMAPEEGLFTLQVHGGNTLKLKCRAKLGTTNVAFVDRRIMFGQVPLHLTTTRIATLKNTGVNHAYFQVLDPNPFPGLTVSPLHGVVPVGGVAELKVDLAPNAVMKFDTRVQIAIRGWKTLELRMGGTVEPPSVDISVKSFNFGGVFCGSSATVLFILLNKTNTKARMEFDLSRYSDFSLAFPTKQTTEDYTFTLMNPGVFSVSLEPNEEVAGELVFKPTEVAAYDFIVPVVINQTGAPTPAATPFPPTPAPTNKNSGSSVHHIIQPRPVHVEIVTPRRKVEATALRQPLQLSHQHLEFTLSPAMHELAASAGYGHSKGTLLVNNSDKTIKWTFDLRNCNEALEQGNFKFLHSSGMPFLTHGEGGVEGTLEPGQTTTVNVLFCPMKPGKYESSVPVVLNDDYEQPYVHFTLNGELQTARLWFDPLAVVLTPVPLETEVVQEFQILASNYTKSSSLEVHIPSVECEDGSKVLPLSITFPQGNEIKPCSGDEGQIDPFILSCKISFKCNKPISFSQHVIFTDDQGNTFKLPVSATADNCLMTCYPFIAEHRLDHQIIVEHGAVLKGRRTASQEGDNMGEAVLRRCASPSRPSSRPSTTATSSSFEVSSSSYEDSSASVSGSYPSTPRDGALNKFPTESEPNSRGRQDLASRSLGSAVFPAEDTEEGIFHTEVMMAVQRWFTSQGWPGGPHPIHIPHSLRCYELVQERSKESGLTKKPREAKTRDAKGNVCEANNLKKEFKTVYDMINHLCGRPVPGIPINNPLPDDPIDRVKQIHWQHATLLTFLRTQGGCVSSIKPEYLMEPEDYRLWNKYQKAVKHRQRTSHGHWELKLKTEEEEAMEQQLFEAVSKRAWTDVCLQLLKTLVLSKITPRQFKNIPTPYRNLSMPMVDPDPMCSNVYCIGERIMLLWMNFHYEHQRKIIWEGSAKGPVPASRWVVNFDFDLLDGLVLASVIGAHVPFVIKTYLRDMYTQPATAEQCLHNALKITSALRFIGIDYDIQAIDITDPNPIALMLLVLHLYNNLPQYIPKSSVEFVGTLHETVKRQVRLSNPSTKPLTYTALIAGHDARDFSLSRGDTITLGPKASLNVTVEFTSRFLRPAEAVLVLVGRRQGSLVGSTLVFNLTTQIDNISSKTVVEVRGLQHQSHMYPIKVKNPFPRGGNFRVLAINYWKEQNTQDRAMVQRIQKDTIRYISPCYELHYIPVEVSNPFNQGGNFRIQVVESREEFLTMHGITSSSNSLMSKVGKKKKKKKQIRSRVDHGQKKLTMEEDDEEGEKDDNDETQKVLSIDSKEEETGLSSFSTTTRSVYLEPKQTSTIEIQFLPFHVGKKQCSILFINEQIGEFIYTVEATVTLPLSQVVPHQVGQEGSVRISSAAAAGAGYGSFGGDDSVIYWRCECGQTLRETLRIPAVNKAREEALVLAAQQLMPEAEMRRREVTGTLHTGSVMANAINTLAKESTMKLANSKKKLMKGASFSVEVDNNLFVAPPAIYIPDPVHRTHSAPVGSRPTSMEFSQAQTEGSDGTVELPIEFHAKKAGHYSCKVVLRSHDDVRVYQIECTVIPEGHEAQIEFSVALHQPLSQNIPIVNQTDHDWPMMSRVDGVGFSGPPSMVAKAFQTCFYPLMFRPQFEGPVQGKLVLTNTADGVDHTFHLSGNGEKPLALQHLTIQTQAKQSITRVLEVPNVTRKKLYYRVESDLDLVTGGENITVLPGKTGRYEMCVKPLRRGHYKGVLSFVAAPNPVKEVDSDGDELPEIDERAEELRYRVWYSLSVIVEPPAPLGNLAMKCACQKRALLEIGLNNPLEAPMTLEVLIKPNNVGLSGSDSVTLPPSGRGVYVLEYAPAVIGECTGSVIFFHPSVGEFWYNLSLSAEAPTPTSLFTMECELGRWVQQTITLNNPTDETLLLVPTVSNCNNFALERDSERPLELHPHSFVKIPLTFMPSALGPADHVAKISFHCEQLGEWIYNVSGIGRLPQPQDPVSISAAAGSNSTLIIPFRNPLDHAVLCDVTLTDKSSDEAMALGTENKPATPFCLLLKHSTAVRLGPKTTLDIPISFAPEEMKKYDGMVAVKVHREDGSPWIYNLAEESEHVPVTDNNTVHELTWTYPVVGYPEEIPEDNQPAVVVCRARERVDERLEVTLSGVAPSSAGPKRFITARAKTPADESPRIPDGVVVGESLALAEEFTYEILYNNTDIQHALDPTIALQLVRKHRDKHTGLVTLIFNIIYAPYTTMIHDVELLVKGATGGLWKFPLRFIATEPEADDGIIIEATGLGKESSVGFRLNSQTKHPVPYNAYFVAGSDRELSVTPQNGELMPAGTKGSLIKVDFLPTKYGKIYQGKLVVQTADMQWTYNIKGILPEYSPPRGLSSHPMSGPHPDPRYRPRSIPNFIRDNLKLTTTGVSSPIKGAPVIMKRHPQIIAS